MQLHAYLMCRACHAHHFFFLLLDIVDFFDLLNLCDVMQGSLVEVFQCLQSLRENLHDNVDREASSNHGRKRWNQSDGGSLDAVDYSRGDAQQSKRFGTVKRRNSWDTKYQTGVCVPAMSGMIIYSMQVSHFKCMS